MPPARGLPSPAGVDAFPIGKEGAGKEEASSGGQDLSALEPEGHLVLKRYSARILIKRDGPNGTKKALLSRFAPLLSRLARSVPF